jgi:nickel-type superoxide dismutase maturation protease
MKINLKKVYFLVMLFCLIPLCSRANFCSCSEKEDLLNYAKNNLKDRGLGEFSEEIIKKGLNQFPVDSKNIFTYKDLFSLSSALCSSNRCVAEKNYKKSLESISEAVAENVFEESIKYIFASKIIFLPADLMKSGMYDVINSIKKKDIQNQVELYFEAQRACPAWDMSIDQCHEAIIKCSKNAQKEKGSAECVEHQNLHFYTDLPNKKGFLWFVNSSKSTSSFPKDITPEEVFNTAKILYEIESNQNQEINKEFLEEFKGVLEKEQTTQTKNPQKEAVIKAALKFLGEHMDLYWMLFWDRVSGKNIYKTFVVRGEAMEPTYKEGDYLLVKKQDNYQKGDVITFKYPKDQKQHFIKRISDIPKEKEYFVLGDNLKHSSDSRSWGTVSHDLVRGKVIKKYLDWPF